MTMNNVLCRQENKVLFLEISRREKKNALTGQMYQHMTALIQDADRKPEISVVVIHGQEDLFTSGNDIRDFLERDKSRLPDAITFLKAISIFSKPLLAAVGGDAIGIGTTLLMHCDFVITSDQSRFQLPFVNLGLCPEAGSSFLLQLLAGPRMASELLLLGDYFDSEKAIQARIVNRACPAEQLLYEITKLADKIAKQPMDALITSKSLMKKHFREQIQIAMDSEINEFSRLLESPPSKEIFSAFLEKRLPNSKITQSMTYLSKNND